MGIGCVFAELFTGKPILVGKTDADQAKIVFELMGSPLTWPDAAKLPHKSEYNSGLACTRTLESRFEKIIPADGIKLLAGLLTLDPYKRFNALDALNHEFSRMILFHCCLRKCPNLKKVMKSIKKGLKR